MNTLTSSHASVLLGDIGGTHARFALVNGNHQPLIQERTLLTTDYPDLLTAVQAYLKKVGHPEIEQTCIAIASPVDGDIMKLTNSHWHFSVEATRKALGLDRLLMINDWEAMALASPALGPDDLHQIGSGEPIANAPKGLIGPGTGLGVSSLVRSHNGDLIALAGEGGHVSLAPTCARDLEILGVMWQKYGHVSAERAISGKGLLNLYEAISQLNGSPNEPLEVSEVTARGLAAKDVACEEALACMCRLLGGTAANLALTIGAKGGIYMGGGVLVHLGDYLEKSGFRAAFEAKGRFKSYMSTIPTYVIQARQPGLIGCAMALGIMPSRC